MRKEDYDFFRNELILKKESLIKRLEKIEKSKKRNDPLPADFAEQAVELENNEVIDALDHLEADELSRINRALESIENDNYGICHSCGEPIAKNRLKALPFALSCVNCAD